MRFHFSLFVITLLALSSAYAATDYTDLPAYEIEIIFFENTGKNDAGSEIWPDLIKENTVVNPIHLEYTENPGMPGVDQHGYYYNLIPESKQQLKSELKKLERSHQYKVLKHVAWIQPGLPEEQAEYIWIDSNDSIDTAHQIMPDITTGSDNEQNNILIEPSTETENIKPGLTGTVKVVLGRFLHIYFDLNFSRYVSTGSGLLHSGEAQEQFNEIRQYPVQVYRRMRSKELHYIDHPVVGILVLATPYEPPVDESKTNVKTSPVLMKLDEIPARQ